MLPVVVVMVEVACSEGNAVSVQSVRKWLHTISYKLRFVIIYLYCLNYNFVCPENDFDQFSSMKEKEFS